MHKTTMFELKTSSERQIFKTAISRLFAKDSKSSRIPLRLIPFYSSRALRHKSPLFEPKTSKKVKFFKTAKSRLLAKDSKSSRIPLRLIHF